MIAAKSSKEAIISTSHHAREQKPSAVEFCRQDAEKADSQEAEAAEDAQQAAEGTEGHEDDLEANHEAAAYHLHEAKSEVEVSQRQLLRLLHLQAASVLHGCGPACAVRGERERF